MYTSLKKLYKQMMFPKNQYARQWTPTEIDQLDVHFFYELIEQLQEEQEPKKVYIDEIRLF